MANPTPQEIIDKNLAKAVDYAREAGTCLKLLEKIAGRDKVALMAFVAPYAAIRVSPVETRFATIGLSEEFGVIGAIDKLTSGGPKSKKTDRLYLLVNSPGGTVHSSYKIAKAIRMSFKHIKVFIPHVAASGGALMAFIGNEIVMGRMSNLTPVDVQVSYKDDYVSANCMVRALSRLSEFFRTTTEDEAPFPWKSMTDKLDPVLLEHWTSAANEIVTYARELLGLSGYPPEVIRGIIDAFVLPDSTHGFVIDRDRASKLKLKLATSAKDTQDLKVMEAWLTDYMLKAADKHVIRFVRLEGKKANGKAKKPKKAV